VRLFFVGQLLLSSSGVFCEGLLLLEDQAHPENDFEDLFLPKEEESSPLRPGADDPVSLTGPLPITIWPHSHV
jgi:hypothetical protein